MSEVVKGPRSTITLADVGQLIAIAAPVLYVMGRQYDVGYYSAIGCDWAVQLITFPETLAHSILPIAAILSGLITGLYLMSARVEFKVILRNFLLAMSATAILYGLSVLFSGNPNLLSSLLVIGLLMMLHGLGLYIADTYFALIYGDKNYRQFSIVHTIISTIMAIGITHTLGSLSATNDMENKDRRLAELVEKNAYSTKNRVYLVSSLGGRFLIIDYLNGKKGNFKLVNDLSNFNVKPVVKFDR